MKFFQLTSVVNDMSIFVISKGKILRPNNLLLFLLCRDINPNHGPNMKAKFNQCFRTITKNHRFVQCEKYLSINHFNENFGIVDNNL